MPLIIVDPREPANETCGLVSDKLVEMIDLVPTFMEAVGCKPKPWVAEGRDLTPILHGQEGFSRNYVISKHDYHWSEMADVLGIAQEDVHTTMIFDGRWKYIRCERYRLVLFDLENDQDELIDLGASEAEDTSPCVGGWRPRSWIGQTATIAASPPPPTFAPASPERHWRESLSVFGMRPNTKPPPENV